MWVFAIVAGCAGIMMAVEHCRPGRRWPRVAGWWLRAVALNAVQVGLVLLAHALLPRAPYGSFAACGRLLTRSSAVLRMLEHLGGGWRILGAAGRVVPRPLRDGIYEAIATLRHRLFSWPAQACPVVPARLRARMLA